MTIYITDERCIPSIKNIEEKIGSGIRYEPSINPIRDLEILRSKDALLIDVFDTFILPALDKVDDLFQLRYGLVKFVEIQHVRPGFPDFIKQYHDLGKKIGIHSDAFTKEEFEKVHDHWKFEGSVDKYFDERYMKDVKIIKDHYIKDLEKMIAEIRVSKDRTLIIGDGRSDIIPSIYHGVDLLLVPPYSDAREFDYHDLM